jgi:hypothetical protein
MKATDSAPLASRALANSFTVAPVSDPLQWVLQSVGMVESFKGCQSLGTERPLVQGTLWVALYSDNAANVINMGYYAAANLAEAAGAFYFRIHTHLLLLHYLLGFRGIVK